MSLKDKELQRVKELTRDLRQVSGDRVYQTPHSDLYWRVPTKFSRNLLTAKSCNLQTQRSRQCSQQLGAASPPSQPLATASAAAELAPSADTGSLQDAISTAIQERDDARAAGLFCGGRVFLL